MTSKYGVLISLPAVIYMAYWLFAIIKVAYPFLSRDLTNLANVTLGEILATFILLSFGTVGTIFAAIWVFVCWTD